MAEIEAMIDESGKAPHLQALLSAHELRKHIHSRAIHTHLFRADATRPLPIGRNIFGRPIDIVFADVPCGRRSAWHASPDLVGSKVEPVHHMLSVLYDILSEQALVIIATGNRQKVAHDRYDRLKQLRVGKRRATILSRRSGNDVQ